MGPAKNDKKLNVNIKTNEILTSEVETLLKKLRKAGITAILAMTKNSQITMSNWAHDLVNLYNVILKNNPIKLKDIAKLPSSKMDIKMAIKILLLASFKKGVEDTTVVDLKDKFISLGAF